MRTFAQTLAASIVCGAAALAAAAPAYAQRASLADRVAVLEQRAANNQANVDLLNQVTQLKSELQALRSQVEELQQQNQQLQQSSKNQYLDLDGRLNRLEGGAPAAPAPEITRRGRARARQEPAGRQVRAARSAGCRCAWWAR